MSDNAKEFKFGKFAEVSSSIRENHIRQEFAATYSRRMWESRKDMEYRCRDGEMNVETANIPETFVSFANRAACHMKSGCIHSSHGKTPFEPSEKFFGKRPDLNLLKAFGCKAFAFVERETKQSSRRRNFARLW